MNQQPAPNHLLTNLQRIINSDIPSFINSRYTLDEDTAAYFLKAVHHEVELIRDGLDASTLLFKGTALEDYIYWHQRNIMMLIGSLLDHIRPADLAAPPPPLSNETLSYHVFTALETLMHTIARNFPAQFKPNGHIPIGYRIILKMQVRHRLDFIEQQLQTSGINHALINIVLTPFYEFVRPDEVPVINFNRITYLRLFKAELLNLCQESAVITEATLHFLLHCNNFNSKEYAHYYINHMRDQIEALPFNEDKRPVLLNRFKTFVQQAHQSSTVPLNPAEIPITTKLLEWLAVEQEFFHHYQSSLKTTYLPPAPAASDALVSIYAKTQPVGAAKKKTTPRKYRLMVNLSVSDLGLLIRILCDIGVLRENNRRRVGRYFGRAFQTIGSAEPHVKRIMAAHDQPPQSAYDTILALNHNIIEYIHKYRYAPNANGM